MRQRAPGRLAFPLDCLICPAAKRRLAAIYGEGARNYGPINYCQGIPPSNILTHFEGHYMKYMANDTTEDHLAKMAWALFTLMHFEEQCEHHIVTERLESVHQQYLNSPAVEFFKTRAIISR